MTDFNNLGKRFPTPQAGKDVTEHVLCLTNSYTVVSFPYVLQNCVVRQ